MSRRTVLILTYHFPPSAAVGGLRLLGFSRHLPRFGWRVEVVAPPQLPWEPVDLALGGRVPPETVVHGVPFTGGFYSEVARRIAPLASWFPKAWMACRRAIRRHRPDVLLTSGPPHHIHALGLGLKRHYRIPWVSDFRDPWLWTARLGDPFMPIALDGSWRDPWRQRMERTVIHSSDVIIANSPQSHAALEMAYPEDKQRMEIITNGFDEEPFVGLPGPDPTDPAIRLLYSGQLYVGRDPCPFLEALRMMIAGRPEGGRPVRTAFVGSFHFDARDYDIEAEIRDRGLSDVVTVRGQIPYADSLAEMVRSSILLLIDTPGRRIGVPAKLYEYIGAGRPVLALVEPDSDAAWVLRQTGVPCRIATPTDPEAIRRALVELIEIIETGLPTTAPAPGRVQFTRRALAQRLAEILDRCAEPVNTAARPAGSPTDPAAGSEPVASAVGDLHPGPLKTRKG